MNVTSANAAPIIITVDEEHAGIRLAIPLLTVGTFILLYAILNSLQYPDTLPAGCIVVVGSLIGAVAAAFIADKVLKRVWRSGRTLTLAPDALTLARRGTTEAKIVFPEPINALAWKFTVNRGSARVPRGWSMLSTKLSQGDTEENPPLVLYTFVSPVQLAQFPDATQFTALVPRAEVESGTLGLRETGLQRLLLASEDERYRIGAEIRPSDLQRVLAAVTPYLQQIL